MLSKLCISKHFDEQTLKYLEKNTNWCIYRTSSNDAEYRMLTYGTYDREKLRQQKEQIQIFKCTLKIKIGLKFKLFWKSILIQFEYWVITLSQEFIKVKKFNFNQEQMLVLLIFHNIFFQFLKNGDSINSSQNLCLQTNVAKVRNKNSLICHVCEMDIVL